MRVCGRLADGCANRRAQPALPAIHRDTPYRRRLSEQTAAQRQVQCRVGALGSASSRRSAAQAFRDREELLRRTQDDFSRADAHEIQCLITIQVRDAGPCAGVPLSGTVTPPQRQVRHHLLRRRRERNAKLAREWDLDKVYRYYMLLQLRSSLTQAAAQKQLDRVLCQQLERDATRCGGQPRDAATALTRDRHAPAARRRRSAGGVARLARRAAHFAWQA